MIRRELLKMPEAEYHADPVPVSLSSSIAKVLIAESPLHAWQNHPRLGGSSKAATPAMDAGKLSHRLLLGAGAEIAVIEADDWRTKAAREARDAAKAAGKIAVKAVDYEEASKACTEIAKRMTKLGIVLDGESELTALWGESTFEGAEVQCRAMLDHVKGSTIYELKSIESASDYSIGRAIEKFGYAIAAEAYTRALEAIRPASTGRIDFVFIFYELEPPYAINPKRLSGEYRELGRRQWRRAYETWAKCIESGEWPGYAEGIGTIEPAPWVLSRDMDEQIAQASRSWAKPRGK